MSDTSDMIQLTDRAEIVTWDSVHWIFISQSPWLSPADHDDDQWIINNSTGMSLMAS